MTDSHEPGNIFLAPNDAHIDEQQQPTADGSHEAMRRLRHPFDVDERSSPPDPAGADPAPANGKTRPRRPDHGR